MRLAFYPITMAVLSDHSLNSVVTRRHRLVLSIFNVPLCYRRQRGNTTSEKTEIHE